MFFLSQNGKLLINTKQVLYFYVDENNLCCRTDRGGYEVVGVYNSPEDAEAALVQLGEQLHMAIVPSKHLFADLGKGQ